MTLTRVVGKNRVEEMPGAALAGLRADATRTVVDVGTGDGRLVLALASAHPEWLVVGLDALDEPMGESAHRASRKPARGGRANVVLLRASVEAVPVELHGIADEVLVMLPWGHLLEGIVEADAAVLRGIATLSHPGTRVEVTLNGEIWAASTPARYEHLPLPTPDYVAETVAPAFAAAGIDLEPAYWMAADDAKALPSTWARKLGHGRLHPKFVRFTGTAR